jgi:hypothetical protein
MSSPSSLTPISGESLHEMFKKMTMTYGVMMTATEPETLGENQAAFIDIDDIDVSADTLEATIKAEVARNTNAMIEPPDSCGDQSNQICMLFLGTAGKTAFSKKPYAVCVQEEEVTQTLQAEIKAHQKEQEDILIRFEVDRCDLHRVSLFSGVATADELKKRIESKSVSREKALILLRGSMCFLSDYQIIEIPALQQEQNQNLAEKKLLESLFDDMQAHIAQGPFICPPAELRNKDTGFPSYLGVVSSQLHDAAIHLVEKTLLRVMNDPTSNYLWLSSHSFTVCISGTPNQQRIYQNQAYAGKHTLQQWFTPTTSMVTTKFDKLSKYTLEEYIEQCKKLLSADGKERAKGYCDLFRRLGEEEFRFKGLAAAFISNTQLRFKYKITQLNPALAKQHLDQLQQFCNKFGATSEAQVAAYKARAIHALHQGLSQRLVEKLKLSSPSQGSTRLE